MITGNGIPRHVPAPTWVILVFFQKSFMQVTRNGGGSLSLGKCTFGTALRLCVMRSIKKMGANILAGPGMVAKEVMVLN